LPPLAKLTLDITPALYPEQLKVLEEVSKLPPSKTGKTVRLKVCEFVQLVKLFLMLSVKE
jgi:hypothetical protein